MSEKSNIYQRVNEVRKKIEYLKKDATVRGGESYRAISHDHVTAAVRDYLIEQGIVVVPGLKAGTVKETGTHTAKGTPWIRYEATYEIQFVNADDPKDLISIVMEAHALDTGDKAPGKAISYATKYAMLKLFNIETGDREEERDPDMIGGMSVAAFEAWEKKIDSLAAVDGGQALWADILAAVKKADDMVAANRLKGRLSAKLTALKKASPAAKKPSQKEPAHAVA